MILPAAHRRLNPIYLGGTIFTQYGDLFCGGRIDDGESVAVGIKGDGAH